MSVDSPLTQLDIKLAKKGFYKDYNKVVTISSKVIIFFIVFWAAFFPVEAGDILKKLQNWSFEVFGAWYIYIMAFYVLVCLGLAIHPTMGKIKLGGEKSKPEFSTFSWLAMMFSAGVGIGMLTFSTAEPIYHFASNPDTILGTVPAQSEQTLRSVYKWAFFHWGLSAWGCYAIVGLVLSFFCYNRNLPLTIRSGLTPLFGKKLEGLLGDIVDISAIIATILGIAVTIGYGISQFSSGMYTVTGAKWMVDANGSPTNAAMLTGLFVIMVPSIWSASSGVGKGVKWLSNINLVLSFALLGFFLIFGPSTVALKSLFLGIWDYMLNFPILAVTYWGKSNVEPAATLFKWQSNWWTVLYWAWWISFAPFVGLFFARISKGRTIREFVLGTMLLPSLMCFVWFTFVGGTAIDLELSGKAAGSILNAGQEAQLFATLTAMLSSGAAKMVSVVVVILLLTYIVTSADSAVLIINTINAGGNDRQKGKLHIIVWGLLLTVLIAALLLAGGLTAIKAVMLIGALPFSVIVGLMAISLIKALINDNRRAKAKAVTTGQGRLAKGLEQ